MRLLLVLILISNVTFSQVNKLLNNPLQRPKLVVGLVVDQMRWDYLYRYYNRYAPDGGFKRMLNQGFSCENTLINYIPTVTACGHTTLYTGAVPAVHGIAGNEWWDANLRKVVYCTDDESVSGVGTNAASGKMSPRNMISTTICDELKLATNFRSKVIGIAFKDRGGILPAGHSADAAYWYEAASGNFVTSSYYMKNLPQWVTDFNAKKLPDNYMRQGWKTLYPIETYTQSTSDEQSYEGKPFGADQKGFPYSMEKFAGKNYGALTSSPFGNSLTKEMAIAAVTNEDLGKDSITDFLAISFSSPDYIGHTFGPNSIEAEDCYLRLDKELGEFFRFLDSKVGKGQYLVFLSADHGVAHVGGFSKQNKLPGGTIQAGVSEKSVDSLLRNRYGNYKFLLSTDNYQLSFDHRLIDSLNLERSAVYKVVVDYLSKQPGIYRVYAFDDVMNIPLTQQIRNQALNGYYPGRSGDIQVLYKPGYYTGGDMGTSHGAWNPYDAHIPLLWYGWNIKPGKTNRETYMTDAAPTIAAMLRIQMPSGCTGKVIEEIVR